MEEASAAEGPETRLLRWYEVGLRTVKESFFTAGWKYSSVKTNMFILSSKDSDNMVTLTSSSANACLLYTSDAADE